MANIIKSAFIGLICYKGLKVIGKKDYADILGFIVIIGIGFDLYNWYINGVNYIGSGNWIKDLFNFILGKWGVFIYIYGIWKMAWTKM